MQLRELSEEQFPALLELCERSFEYDRFTLPLLRDRILREPEHRPAYQLGLWDGDRLAGAMLGSVRDADVGHVAGIRLFAVDREYRRQGLATRLLEELQGRMRADGLTRVRVGGIAPIYFWPGLDLRFTPAYCFLLNVGFQYTDGAVNMLVDLHAHSWDTAADEARLASEGFEVRRLEEGDREQLGDWMQRVWNPGWRAEALHSYSNDPVSTFIATRNGRICSFATYGVAAFENGFGPTGTEEELRGKGLGRVLFHRCMRELRELGHDTSEVIWVGPIVFYARVADAWIHRAFWFLEKTL